MGAVSTPPLDAAYAACRRAHRRYDPTYYWATRRLPPDVRPAVHALYAFVRHADELVDGPGRHPDPAARRGALDAWHAVLEEGRARGSSDEPVVAALVDAEGRHGLALDELDRYIDSMRRDCGALRIATWTDLEEYMDGSAGSVGRILAPLLGAPAGAEGAFGRLGRGFQLANFLRDVREDHELGRVYLPAEDLTRFRTGEEDIARGRATPGFRALIAFEAERARRLLAAGDEAANAAAPSVRGGMRLARAVYEAVLDRIEHVGFDVLGRRTTPPPWAIGRAAWAARRAA
jgi:phytoene synthase